MKTMLYLEYGKIIADDKEIVESGRKSFRNESYIEL